MKILLAILFGITIGYSQSYPPAAGIAGSTAIPANSPDFVAWATGIAVVRGYVNISNPALTAGGSNFASAGLPEYALGAPNSSTVSLGDGGSATLTFVAPIVDGSGFDFAVFENGSTAYLELAFVEASSDGVNFFRFPSHSQTQTDTQLGTFGTPQATYLNNFAGKYAGTHGTPFDLSELPDNALLDKNNVTHIRVVDVVGSITSPYASYDSFGNAVNESFPTPFASCGFDLQAVGVIHQAELANNENEFSGLSFYPNPVVDYLYVNGIEDAVVSVFDVSGKLVFSQDDVQQPVDFRSLSTGFYLVELQSDSAKKVIRILKSPK